MWEKDRRLSGRQHPAPDSRRTSSFSPVIQYPVSTCRAIVNRSGRCLCQGTRHGQNEGQRKDESEGEGGEEASQGDVGKPLAPAKTKEERKPLSRPEIFNKPKDLQLLFQAFREGELGAETLRPRLQDRVGRALSRFGILRNCSFRRFIRKSPKQCCA